MRLRAQIKIVGAQAVRTLASGPLDLAQPKVRLDDSDDRLGDPILQFEYVVERAVEPVGPEMSPCVGLDQLRGDAQSVGRLAHAAFQHIAHSEFAPDLPDVDRSALVDEGRISGDTNSHLMRESAVVMSSTMPSTKYSCSASPLMFWNGSTAMDGLSGSDALDRVLLLLGRREGRKRNVKRKTSNG